MAQLIYRVTGRRGEERVFQTFRSTDEGRRAASLLATEPAKVRTLRRATSPTVHDGAKLRASTVRAVVLGAEAMA